MKKGYDHINAVIQKYNVSREDLQKVVTVGDGPVEMRLGKEHNMKSIGIARNN